MRRRAIDRLVDEQMALNTFYHVSDMELPIGRELVAWPTGLDASTPPPVDDIRPPGTKRRADHFFMVQDFECLPHLGQDDPQQLVYEVVPTTPVSRHDYGWIAEIWQTRARGGKSGYKKDPKMIQAAESYWNGTAHPDSACLDEYLTESFIPVREVGWLGELLADRGINIEDFQ